MINFVWTNKKSYEARTYYSSYSVLTFINNYNRFCHLSCYIYFDWPAPLLYIDHVLLYLLTILTATSLALSQYSQAIVWNGHVCISSTGNGCTIDRENFAWVAWETSGNPWCWDREWHWDLARCSANCWIQEHLTAHWISDVVNNIVSHNIWEFCVTK